MIKRTSNMSAIFVAPLLELTYPSTLYTSDFVDTYLKKDEEDPGKFIYYLYERTVDPKIVSYFEAHKSFVERQDTEDGKILLKMRVDDEAFEKVMKPFLAGKYSQVDKDYVEKYFSTPAKRTARMIFDRDPSLRDQLERDLDVRLPHDAEVYSKVDIKQETYGSHELLLPSDS